MRPSAVLKHWGAFTQRNKIMMEEKSNDVRGTILDEFLKITDHLSPADKDAVQRVFRDTDSIEDAIVMYARRLPLRCRHMALRYMLYEEVARNDLSTRLTVGQMQDWLFTQLHGEEGKDYE